MTDQYALTISASTLSPGAVSEVREAVARYLSPGAKAGPAPQGGPQSTIVRLELELPSADVSSLALALLELGDRLRVDVNLLSAAESLRPRRLFVFDMDSTLTQEEGIDELAKVAGVGEQVARITAAAMRGELDFQQSFRRRIALLRGLKESRVRETLGRATLSPGAGPLLRSLHARGCRLAIASGGFSIVGEDLRRRFAFDHVHTNRLEFADGQVTGNVLGDIIDGARKAALLRDIAKLEGIPLEEVVAVGDGANDLAMLAAAGIGVAFRAKPVLRKAATLRLSYSPLDTLLGLVST